MLVHNLIGKPSSFQKKLLFLLLLISIIPALSLGLAANHLFSQQLQQEVNRNHRLTLTLLHDRLNDKISAMKLSLSDESVAAGPGHESLLLIPDLHPGTGELNGFLSDLELDDRMKIYVIDDAGRLIYSRERDEIGTVLTAANELYDYWLEPADDGDKVMLDQVRYAVSAQKSDFNWTCLVMTPYEELMKKSDRMKGVTWGIAGVFMLLCAAFALFGFRALFRPLRSVLAKMQTTGDEPLPYGHEMEALDAGLQRLIGANKHLQREIREHMPLAKERVYHYLINGELDESEVRLLSDRFGLPLRYPWIYVGVVQVDDYIRFDQAYRGRERSMIHNAMRKAAEEICEHTVPCITFIPEPGQIVVLFAAEKADDKTFGQICQLLKQFRVHAADGFRFTVSAAISDARRDYACIGAGYREALQMLSYRLLYGHNVTITTRDIRQRAQLLSEESVLRCHKSIVVHLLQGNAEGAARELEHWLEAVRLYSPSPEHAIGLLSCMLGELEYKLHEAGCRLREIAAYDLYGRLRQMTAMTEIRAWLQNELFPAVVCHLELVQDPRSKRVVRQVETYLLERYEEDISLQSTADRFGISPSFLSRIFKEATGRSFSDYLLEIRMNKAMEWLAYTDWPLQHISDRLTYSTVQNFSRIFKKMTGAPPGEYRRQRREDSRTS